MTQIYQPNADEIVSINESGQIEIGFDRSKYNTGIIDQAVWTKALNSIFSSKGKKGKYDEYPKKWHFFITSSKFLNDSFKNLFKFPLTETEKENKQIEDDNRLKEHTCVNCKRLCIDDDNKVGSCSYHPSLLINKLIPDKAYQGVTKEQMSNIARERVLLLLEELGRRRLRKRKTR